jgi:predicted anti-sigma-YlaC factor YlaD
MEPGLEHHAELDCETARLQASLALDGAVQEEVALERLWGHLGACAACARFAADVGHATSLVRSAPPVPFRCELTSPRLLRSCVEAQRGPWATAAVVLGAVVLGMSQFPGAGDGAGDDGTRHVRSAAPPPKLPIGQRSAADDFVTGQRVVRRAGAWDGAAGVG